MLPAAREHRPPPGVKLLLRQRLLELSSEEGEEFRLLLRDCRLNRCRIGHHLDARRVARLGVVVELDVFRRNRSTPDGPEAGAGLL